MDFRFPDNAPIDQPSETSNLKKLTQSGKIRGKSVSFPSSVLEKTTISKEAKKSLEKLVNDKSSIDPKLINKLKKEAREIENQSSFTFKGFCDLITGKKNAAKKILKMNFKSNIQAHFKEKLLEKSPHFAKEFKNLNESALNDVEKILNDLEEEQFNQDYTETGQRREVSGDPIIPLEAKNYFNHLQRSCLGAQTEIKQKRERSKGDDQRINEWAGNIKRNIENAPSIKAALGVLLASPNTKEKEENVLLTRKSIKGIYDSFLKNFKTHIQSNTSIQDVKDSFSSILEKDKPSLEDLKEIVSYLNKYIEI